MKKALPKIGFFAFATIAMTATASLAATNNTLTRSAKDCDVSLNYTSGDQAGGLTEKIEGIDIRWRQGNEIFIYALDHAYNIVDINDEASADSTTLTLERRELLKLNTDGKPVQRTSRILNYTFNADGTPVSKITNSKVRTEYKENVTLDSVVIVGQTANKPTKTTRTELGDGRYTLETVTEDLDMDASGDIPAVHVDNQTMTCTFRETDADEFAKIVLAKAIKATAAFDVLMKKPPQPKTMSMFAAVWDGIAQTRRKR
jgi:hypothetical protein